MIRKINGVGFFVSLVVVFERKVKGKELDGEEEDYEEIDVY